MRLTRSHSSIHAIRLATSAAVALLLLSAATALAQPGSKRPAATTVPRDASRQGDPVTRGGGYARLEIGELVPDFELEDPNSVGHKLSSLRGGWVALVFAGGREAMTGLDTLSTLLEADGIRMAAIFVEKAQTLKRFPTSPKNRLLVLADPTHEVTAMFGLWDEITGSPLPGWVLITPEGIARVALLGQGLPNREAHALMRYLASTKP